MPPGVHGNPASHDRYGGKATILPRKPWHSFQSPCLQQGRHQLDGISRFCARTTNRKTTCCKEEFRVYYCPDVRSLCRFGYAVHIGLCLVCCPAASRPSLGTPLILL